MTPTTEISWSAPQVIDLDVLFVELVLEIRESDIQDIFLLGWEGFGQNTKISAFE